jgi:hypothetical protein
VPCRCAAEAPILPIEVQRFERHADLKEII